MASLDGARWRIGSASGEKINGREKVSQEFVTLAVVIVGAIIVLLLRRSSEIRLPTRPANQPAIDRESVEVEAHEDRIPITHPMIRRAAEKALARGGEVAKYIVREDGQLYFSFRAIADLSERQRAVDVVTKIQAGQDAEMSEVTWLVRRIFREE